MASKDRIMRLKDDTRLKILDAVLLIVQNEGWQAVSMRKIADMIEYTAPMIYEYFSSKDGILLEFTKMGYFILAGDIRQARDSHEKPEDKMEAMWVAYWNFAFSNKEFYKLMYGVEMACCNQRDQMQEASSVELLMTTVIVDLFNNRPYAQKDVHLKYYAYWSVVHGLISINLVYQHPAATEEINQEILRGAIKAVTNSFN